MTVTQVLDAIRRKYNAVGDTFFSDAEIYGYMYAGSLQMAREALVIENTLTTPSVDGQQNYAYPSQCISIKRITYDGVKLKQITFREDDAITLMDADTTEEGTPRYYYLWDSEIFLRPIPDTSALTIKIYTYSEPQAVSATSTLEIPSQFHYDLVDYCVGEMAMKDSNFNTAEYHRRLWEKHVLDAKRWSQKRKRGDAMLVVQDEETLNESILGSI